MKNIKYFGKVTFIISLMLNFTACTDKSSQWSDNMKNLVVGKCSVEYQKVHYLPDNANLLTIMTNDKIGYKKIIRCQEKLISKYTPEELMHLMKTDYKSINAEIDSYVK